MIKNNFLLLTFISLILIPICQGSHIISQKLSELVEEGYEKCEYSRALGFDYQIIEKLKETKSFAEIPANEPEKFELYPNLTVNLLADVEILTNLEKAQLQGNKKMVIKQTLVLQGQQYLRWQWNEVKGFQSCGHSGKKPGESVFQSGLAIEIEDHEYWTPYMEANNFSYYSDENAFIYTNLDLNLIPDIFTTQIALAEESLNSITLNYSILEGKLIRSEIDSFLYSLDEASIQEIGNVPILGYSLSATQQHMFSKSYVLENLSTDNTSDRNWQKVEAGGPYVKYTTRYDGSKGKFICEHTIFTVKFQITEDMPQFYKYEFYMRGTAYGEYYSTVGEIFNDQIELYYPGQSTNLKDVVSFNPEQRDVQFVFNKTQVYQVNDEVEFSILFRPEKTEYSEQREIRFWQIQLSLFTCPVYCKTCAGDNPLKCTSCQDTDNRELSGDLCVCKTGFIDPGFQNACIRQPNCQFQLKGPLYNHHIFDNNQTSIVQFPDFRTAAQKCDEIYECQGIEYSKKGNGETYSYQLRNSQIAYAMNNEELMNQKEEGLSIAWVKKFQEGCCYVACENCFITQDYNGCIDCKEGYYKQVNACVSICDNGFYKDEEAMQCLPCHSSCKACEGPNQEQCTQCASGLKKETNYDNPSKCLQECPVGTSYNEKRRFCEICHENCASCEDQTNQQCPVCKPNIYRFGEFTCLSECPIGYSPDDESRKCIQCHSSCVACDGPSENNCLECAHPQLLDFEERTCNDSCFEGKFNIKDKVCALVCPLGLYFDRVNMRCVEVCPDEYFSIESTQECVKCLEQGPGWKIQGKTCVEDCQIGYYQENEDLCSTCNENCRGCTGPNSNQCTKCFPPLIVRKGECVQVCQTQQYYNYEFEKCDNCFSSCEICMDYTHKCKKCNHKFPYYIKLNTQEKQCYSECPAGYKREIKQDSWVKNEIECIPCDLDSDEECTLFPEDSECVQGKYHNSEGKCELCPIQNCIQCDKDNIQNCILCSQNYYLQTASNKCLSCHSSCLTCIGPSKSECLTCKNFKTEGTLSGEAENTVTCDTSSEDSAQNLYEISNFSYDGGIYEGNLSTKENCHRSKIIQFGDPIHQNIAENLSDCSHFKEGQFESQIPNLQDLLLYASVLSQNGVKSTDKLIDFSSSTSLEERKTKFEQDLDNYLPQHLNDYITKSNGLFKRKFSINYSQIDTCNQIECQYILKDTLFISTLSPEKFHQFKLQKGSFKFQFFGTQGKPLTGKNLKQNHQPIQESNIKNAQNLIKQLAGSNKYLIVTVQGKLKSDSSHQILQTLLIKEYQDKTYDVFSPLLGEQLRIKLEGEDSSASHSIFEHYNVRNLQELKVNEQEIDSQYKFGLRMRNSELNDDLLNCLQGYKSDTFDLLILDINQSDGQRDIIDSSALQDMKNLAQSKYFKIQFMFTPCLDKSPGDIATELKAANLHQESLITEYQSLWMNLNGIPNYSELYDEVSYQKCEFDRFNLGKNADIVKNLITEIRGEGIPLGVYSNDRTWESKLGNTDSISRQFGDDVKLWVLSTQNHQYEIDSSQFFGGWESAKAKSFAIKYPICGIETELFSYKNS